MKVLIYAINGKGMGHLNRTLVMARALREHDPTADIRFAVGSPFFDLVAGSGFEVCKIPDRHHLLGYHAARPARDWHVAGLFDCLFEDAAPDVFVVDLAVDELLFRTANARGARVALVWRQQRPESIREAQRRLGIRRVERFLIPHDAAEAPLTDLPSSWRARARYLGPVARTLDLERVAHARARYALPDQRLVLVTLGGGGYPETHQILHAAEAVAQRCDDDTRWLIVYGPYFRGEIPPSDARVMRLRYEADLLELMTGADAVVCSAGYNTLAELELAGTPAVIVPIEGTGRDDQGARAQALVDRGRALLSGPEPGDLALQLSRLVAGEVARAKANAERINPELGARIASALEQ